MEINHLCSSEDQVLIVKKVPLAVDFWTALVVFHGRLVVLSFQLSEAENFVKPQDAQPFVFSKTEQQRSIEEEAVARFEDYILLLC